MRHSRSLITFSILIMPILVVSLSSCGDSKSGSTDKTKLDSSYTPQTSLSDAVEKVLASEQKNDHQASFAVLEPAARTQYKDVADWTKRRSELPAVTGFKLESPKDDTLVAAVDHKPALDPFKGLSPAKETQKWTGKRYDGGWLVEPDPQTDPVLPSDAKAANAAKAWAQAVQACDKDRAHALQAVDSLLATTTPTLCKQPGDVTVAAPSALAQGPESAAIVDQYSTDALVWAKTVAVTTPSAFHVVLAPLGDEWRVFALY